ncbi:hypothetical protein Hanom_Chr07g00605211 [Helianthus anomalus]
MASCDAIVKSRFAFPYCNATGGSILHRLVYYGLHQRHLLHRRHRHLSTVILDRTSDLRR